MVDVCLACCEVYAVMSGCCLWLVSAWLGVKAYAVV